MNERKVRELTISIGIMRAYRLKSNNTSRISTANVFMIKSGFSKKHKRNNRHTKKKNNIDGEIDKSARFICPTKDLCPVSPRINIAKHINENEATKRINNTRFSRHCRFKAWKKSLNHARIAAILCFESCVLSKNTIVCSPHFVLETRLFNFLVQLYIANEG